MFVIEDEVHAEPGMEFATEADALAEMQRLAALPWNEPPNLPPCQSWRTCGRRYWLVEYDVRGTPWRRLASRAMLEISSTGACWLI